MTIQIPDVPRISDFVTHYAEQTPTAEAARADGILLTYADLDEAVTACAKALIQAGVARGDRVATLSTPHTDFLVTFLAAASIGAIWIGLNPRYTREEYEYVIGDAQPKLIFARTKIGDRSYGDDLAALRDKFSFIEDIVTLQGDPAPACASRPYDAFINAGTSVSSDDLAARRGDVDRFDPALIVYTSGTTGKPKGALIHHGGLVTCARVQSRYWVADPVRIVNFLPINHIGCVGDISCFTLACGGCNIFLEQFDPLRSMEMIPEYGATLWGGIPTTLQMSLDLPEAKTIDLSSVQMIAWSGAAAPKQLIDRLQKITPKLSNAYGMTETVGSVTFTTADADAEVLANTVGAPVPEYGVRVARPDGTEAAVGEDGEIQVRGDFIMRGYWNKPDATAETIDKDGWLHTGDVGCMREDGNLALVGRMKEMFKSGGYNVYPREVEIVLERHPAVAMAAVLGKPDPLFAEVGHAFIIPNVGMKITGDELKTYCREHLANYKVPKAFDIEANLPLLPIGKIDKPALRKRLADESAD